jgi:hypothetical protein
MYAFLILSSLSVGFYLFLLVALHRDGRRRRKSSVTALPTEFGGRRGIRLARSNNRVSIGEPFTAEVQWRPVTRIQWKPPASTTQVNQSKPAFTATSANSPSQMKCG